MKRRYDESLSKHTTFNIGGPVDELSIPENEKELTDEVKRCQEEGINYRILGKGSNILVNDNGIEGVVIKNTKAVNNIEKKGNVVKVGSSVSLQKFVRFCVNNNLEGMEYLTSIPATVGGAIYMNAGRGKKHNLSISDNLVSVKIFDGEKIKFLKKEDCDFTYRESIFQKKDDWIILEGEFELDDQPREVGEKKINDRMKKVKQWPIYKYPSAGTVFKQKSSLIHRLASFLKIGDVTLKNGKIVNLGDASFSEVLLLINILKLLNYMALTKPELEIEVWYK